MKPENGNHPSHRSDTELMAVLEEAERRRDSEWRQAGRKGSYIIGISVACLLLWAAVFLIQHHLDNPPEETKPAVIAQVEEAPGEQPISELDNFRPKPGQLQESLEKGPLTGHVIDKGDINFAMQLFNFTQTPHKPAPNP